MSLQVQSASGGDPRSSSPRDGLGSGSRDGKSYLTAYLIAVDLFLSRAVSGCEASLDGDGQ